MDSVNKAIIALCFIFSVAFSQRTNDNFGFTDPNFQHQQRQAFAPFIVNGPSPSQQQVNQQFVNGPPSSIQIFHQFHPNPTSESPQTFHAEQPPSLIRQQPQPPANNLQREGRNQKRMMSDTCLACLCKASTDCKMSTQCISNDEYCGAFLISKPYWTDAQKPVITGDSADRDGAFIDCATDPVCSAQTVRNYMNRFEKDCNGDGAIDCDDLARIHLMSAFNCENPKVPSTGFYQKFRQCWDRVLQLSQ